MSCSDLTKSKKRKLYNNMGDVLGKECGEGEKDLSNESSNANIREEADGAPSFEEKMPAAEAVNGFQNSDMKDARKVMGPSDNPPDYVPTGAFEMAMQKLEGKPCSCDTCKDRRDSAAEQLKEMQCTQNYWTELRLYIRTIYRNALEGRVDSEEHLDTGRMTELIHKLCAREPHHMFQKLEIQVQESVIEVKVRQMELVNRDKETPELAKIFFMRLLDGYEKLCYAATQLSSLLHPFESEHLKQFNLTWEIFTKHIYQSCLYTEPALQDKLSAYLQQLQTLLPEENAALVELLHNYLALDDEMTLIGTMWRDAETLVHAYNQEQATMKAKQRMLREDWRMFKEQRKKIQQNMWNNKTCDLGEIGDHLLTLAGYHTPPCSNEDGSYCPGCNSRRGCLCDECAITHLLTCGGLISSPPSDFPAAPVHSYKAPEVLENHNHCNTHPVENGTVTASPGKQAQDNYPCSVCTASHVTVNTTVDSKVIKPSLNHISSEPAGFTGDSLPPTTDSNLPPSLAAGFSVPYAGPRMKAPAKSPFGKTGALCREHSKLISAQTLQNSISTQTSAEKNKAPHQPVVRQKTTQTSAAKKVPPNSGQVPSGTRHPTTHPPNHPQNVQGHSHQNQPDVVKCAATSTTHNRPSGKVPPHSCHKNLKNGEPIKRVPSGEYDGDATEVDESDDTCSERSTSTNASTQKDSKHCDCCYCEVFGHGMPSVAPVSRNYQEMRERLRLLLTKKKAKCKSGDTNGGTTPASSNGSPAQVPPGSESVKPPSPCPVPELTKQDSSDSLTTTVKDARDLEALLEFIEGNQSSKMKNEKKAAKKARQKQKKQEVKEKQTQEDELQQRIQHIQEESPEVTITVVNTAPSNSNSSMPQKNGSPVTNKQSRKNTKKASAQPINIITEESPPQMVTIKRVMEQNGLEPTVTITLKGSTPEEDKVLFTLINGQVLPSPNEVVLPATRERWPKQTANVTVKAPVNSNKHTSAKQPACPSEQPTSNTASNSNNSNNGKKKKNKGNNNNNSSSISNSSSSNIVQNVPSGNKTQHSTSKNVVSVLSKVPTSSAKKSQQPPQPVLPPNVHLRNSRPASADTSSGSAQKYVGPPSKTKSEPAVKNGSFTFENLKLPPGITITKVDSPSVTNPKKPPNKPVESSNKHVNSFAGQETTTIVASPTTGSSSKLGSFPPNVSGSNVIVVDTSRMKEEIMYSRDLQQDNQNQQGNGSKKSKKKKNKNGNQDVSINGHNNGKPQPQSRPHPALSVSNINSKQVNGTEKIPSQQGANLRIPSLMSQQKQNSPTQNSANSTYGQAAIIKVSGSMVTIRNPSHEARFQGQSPFSNGRPEIYMNGDVPNLKSPPKEEKKAGSPYMNGLITKGKENSAFTSKFDTALLRARSAEYNGNIHEESEYRNSSIPPRLRQQFQAVQAGKITPSQFSQYIEEAELAAQAQAQSGGDLKKKKKKKKGAAVRGRPEDWSLESVFAPKDIDLEDGDIDDDEKELEAFKRFCFNSVPPKRKEKVHLNIKDIVLKKKSSAVGCS